MVDYFLYFVCCFLWSMLISSFFMHAIIFKSSLFSFAAMMFVVVIVEFLKSIHNLSIYLSIYLSVLWKCKTKLTNLKTFMAVHQFFFWPDVANHNTNTR